MKNRLLPLAALACFASFSGFARADTPGISFTAPGVNLDFNNGSGFVLGYAFTTNAATDVTALGYFDMGSLAEPHQVGLFDSSGNLLASTTVTGNGAQVGFFNFDSISPVLLPAGQEFEVVGTSGFVDPYTFGTVGFTVEPTITFVQDAFCLGNTLQFAGLTTGLTAAEGGGIFGGNFETDTTSVTPEPNALLLFGTGALGLAGALRRRQVARG